MDELLNFLNSVKENCKSMKKWVNSVLKIVARRSEPTEHRAIAFSFERSPPPIETHLRVPEEEWNILTVNKFFFIKFKMYIIMRFLNSKKT